MYSAELLKHFQDSSKVGDVHKATVAVESQNPVCGDVLRLSLRVDAGVITEVRFRAKGCVPAIACGARLADLLQGLTVQKAADLNSDTIETEVGGLPEASKHAAALAIQTLRSALKSIPR
ncbi:MAG TPA: iron-sulfur cluster assembly scaffold protein [Terriglobales bacterium]|nr:iron-sulfur cluster assembly scaffold protein [Terriglobales bacterium]